MRQKAWALACALSLVWILATPAAAQDEPAADRLFTGSGSFADVIQGSHSRPPLDAPPVSQAGTVGDRIDAFRQGLRGGASDALVHRVNAVAVPGGAGGGALASPIARGLFRGLGRLALRLAPLALGPVGPIVGLAIVAATIAVEVASIVHEARQTQDEGGGAGDREVTDADRRAASAAVAEEVEAEADCRQNDPLDNVTHARTRGEALRMARAFTQIARDGRGGIDLGVGTDVLNETSRGANLGYLFQQGLQTLGRYDTVTGATYYEHPDGHPHMCGPEDHAHHASPHIHAINRHGIERIFTYPPLVGF